MCSQEPLFFRLVELAILRLVESRPSGWFLGSKTFNSFPQWTLEELSEISNGDKNDGYKNPRPKRMTRRHEPKFQVRPRARQFMHFKNEFINSCLKTHEFMTEPTFTMCVTALPQIFRLVTSPVLLLFAAQSGLPAVKQQQIHSWQEVEVFNSI